MRASRLLQMLLLLQNRGRMTCARLAEVLEVTRRTVLRDVDALTEAGLPVIVHRGPRGGIELGFNYRTRLTGLSTDEAEAFAVMLTHPMPALQALGLGNAAARAKSKMVESLPDLARRTVTEAEKRFRFAPPDPLPEDPRVAALAGAIRQSQIVILGVGGVGARTIHPVALIAGPKGWSVVDERYPEAPIPDRNWGSINIPMLSFLIPHRPRTN